MGFQSGGGRFVFLLASLAQLRVNVILSSNYYSAEVALQASVLPD